MGYLSEKVAYLKGLAEGLDVQNDSKEGKMLNAIIEVLDEMALEVDDMVIIQEEMQEQLDEVDEALADLEEEYYEIDDLDDYDEFEDESEEEEYAFVCPKCNDVIRFHPELVDDEVKFIVCPNCGEKINL